ncbi:hypothetical protein EVAR_12451_1 [Eumeta japonica]|uniref:Uncharacterized protein n=1 Tax=Eumeta variegata TaxID=151549 RepID=A0A4C1TPE7_EUMVA|nr:hypothetical protein EVAR_12451_1 [Eumeta japonica]
MSFGPYLLRPKENHLWEVTKIYEELRFRHGLRVQFLSEKGIAVPVDSINEFITAATPAMNPSCAPSPSVASGKHYASAGSSDASTDQFDGTVRGLDSEQDDPFTAIVIKKRSSPSRQR